MRYSKRAAGIAESATLKVTRRAQELRSEGREILSFSAGEPDFASPAVAVEAARQALADGFTRYTPGSGTPELRSALAEHYHKLHDAPWDTANAIVTVGGKAALFELFEILVDRGDEVVLNTPAWVSFPEQIRFAGGVPVEVKTSLDEAFRVRAEPILEALTDKTRVVLLNSPSNPTGGVITAEDLRKIVEACAQRDIIVLSDETYERFVYEGEHVSAVALAKEFPDTVVLVSSFSKTYAMTGWRIGYALGPAALIKKMVNLQSHMTSNPTSFAMKGALAALLGAEEDVQKMLAEFRRRREVVVAGLEKIDGVRCLSPGGAFYVFPHVAACYKDGQGSIDLAESLLVDAGVAVVPGIAFGDDAHVRLSFATSMEIIEKGLQRLGEALTS